MKWESAIEIYKSAMEVYLFSQNPRGLYECNQILTQIVIAECAIHFYTMEIPRINK